MELSTLNGNIIGIITSDIAKENYNGKKVQDMITLKTNEALKMVGLTPDYLTKNFEELSSNDQNKVILASKLNENVIILNDFTKGMLNKELLYFKNLLKKISTYNKKIILISNDMNFFFKLVDHVYVINEEQIIYETTDLTSEELYEYVDKPNLLKFVDLTQEKGINLPYYLEFNDLLKAVYRLKNEIQNSI